MPPPAPVAIDSAAPAPAPLELTETPQTLYDGATKAKADLVWKIAGETLRIDIVISKKEPTAEKFEARILALRSDSDSGAPLFACKDLLASQGRVDLVLRGKSLHILCINAATEGDPGTMDAVRLRYDPKAQKAVESGSYAGDASLDLDTIELDEGEDIVDTDL